MPYFTAINNKAFNDSVTRLKGVLQKQNPARSESTAYKEALKQAISSNQERSARFTYQGILPNNVLDPIKVNPKSFAQIRKRVAYGLNNSQASVNATMATLAKNDFINAYNNGVNQHPDKVFAEESLARMAFHSKHRTDKPLKSSDGTYSTIDTSGPQFVTSVLNKRLQNVRAFDTYKQGFNRVVAAEGGERFFRNGKYQWHAKRPTLAHGFDRKYNQDLVKSYPNGIAPIDADRLLLNRFLTSYDQRFSKSIGKNAWENINPNQRAGLMSAAHHLGTGTVLYGRKATKTEPGKPGLRTLLQQPNISLDDIKQHWAALENTNNEDYKNGFAKRFKEDFAQFSKPYQAPVFR